VLFQQHDPATRQQRSIRTEALLRGGELNPQGLFVAEHPKGILGVMLCTPAPGAVALVWPPQVVPCAAPELIEDRLCTTALNWLRSQNVKLAQVLLTAAESGQAAPLLRHGFEHVTTLAYLRQELASLPEREPAALRFEPCTADNAELFAATLLRTYEGTQDCPELNGVRTIEEILAGHRAQGVFAPERWWLVTERSAEGDGCVHRPVGVLLVNALAEDSGWEIIYMGVIPEARGRGLGRQLTEHALHTAAAHGVAHVDLCVDRRNLFARRVYEALGFTPFAERDVFLALLAARFSRTAVTHRSGCDQSTQQL
jgi:GNAT superfamily N-acetyltransferase